VRLCLIGKFPPIQGGVSTRMYRLAHSLARRGNAVHVVTNAMEVEDAYRVTMTPEDLSRLAARYEDGYVRVHNTVLDTIAQWHVPWHNPYATKLAGLAIEVIRDHALDCVFSWYLEPYGVAGHLAANFTGIPHVLRTAGSDVGRLWHQPGMRSLYDQVFLAADVIMASGSLRKSLADLGVRPERIAPTDSTFVPLDEFAPEGDVLDLRDFGVRATKPAATAGIYGKLGRFKGIRSLLRAIRTCVDLGTQVQLAAMVQGRPEEERGFEDLLDELNLHERVVRVPFLPHWRVPEFLRACDVVCCLEQDFPIKAHSPIIAQEVLATGRPLLLSQEIAAKQPEAHRLAHRYNCWVVRDSTDHDEITGWLLQAISDPLAVEVGARGRKVAEHVQSLSRFPAAHESAMRLAVDGSSLTGERGAQNSDPGEHGLFELLGNARREIGREAQRRGVNLPEGSRAGVEWFRHARDALAAAGTFAPTSVAEQSVRLALQLLEARREGAEPPYEALFRLRAETPCFRVDALAAHRPALAPGVVARTYPASPLDMLTGVNGDPGGPGVVLVVLPFSPSQSVKLYVLSGPAAELVMASDGSRSLAKLARTLRWPNGKGRQKTLDLAEELFALGVLSLAAPPVRSAVGVSKGR
jgi:glycosyltransferase involved in cell wall biosynthesis